jgi:hypothetical protein
MAGSSNQRKLFEFLREREINNAPFTVPLVAERTGLSEASVKTYVSKKLLGRWVERQDATHFRVNGVARMSPGEFAALMSQKAVPASASRDFWTLRLRELIHDGRSQGFPVEEIVNEILRDA